MRTEPTVPERSDPIELMAWVKSEKEKANRVNPWVMVRLEFPNGDALNHEVHEMRKSEAVRMNGDRAAMYMRSQRNRAEKLAKWEKDVKSAESEAATNFKSMGACAQEAATAAILLPDSKQSKELLAYRRSHVAEIAPPEPRSVPRPNLDYGPDDALWITVEHSGETVKHYEN